MKHGFPALVLAFLAAASSARAELHPIVEVENGFLLGAVNGKKWISGEAAKGAVKGGQRYRVYSLTESVGIGAGAKPLPDPDEVCQDVYTVALKPRFEAGVIAVG